MNKVILLGRVVRDPEVRYHRNGDGTQGCIGKYTLAVDRRFKKEGEPTADFISCVAFGKQGEFAEKYLKKGTKIAICGRIQTGSYLNKDGQKVYTTDIVVEEQEFAESKQTSQAEQPSPHGPSNDDGWMNVSDAIGEDELPFS